MLPASSATSTPRFFTAVVTVLPCSLVMGTLAVAICPVRSSLSVLAWTFSVVSAFWALLPCVGRFLKSNSLSANALGANCHLVALMLGVFAALIQTVLLGTRSILVLVELWNGFPWPPSAQLVFEPEGIWTQTMLFAACAGGLVAAGDPRLYACTLWSTAGIALWACLTSSPFSVTPRSIVERTGLTVILTMSLGVLTILATLTTRGPADSGTGQPHQAPTQPPHTWPGFHASCSVLAAALVLCIAYHLAVPVRNFYGWSGLAPALTFVVSALGAYSTLQLGVRRRIDGLTNAGLGLASLSFLSLAPAVLQTGGPRLAEAYPDHFNAMLTGGAIAMVAGTRVLLFLRKAPRETNHGLRPFLAPLVRRCTFLSGCLTLLIATMMAVWPRLPAIAASDDSLGRMVAGFAGCVAFTLVSAYTAMRLGGWSFHLLTVLSLLTATGFVWARILPYSG